MPTARPLTDWPSVSVELLDTQTRIVQGERFYHRAIISGSPDLPMLILIHGIGGHGETWARNMHNLGKHFHVFAIDAVYHGLSSKEPWISDRWLDIYTVQSAGLADLIKAAGHTKAYVAGESMGAGTAYEFGLQYPDMCLGVCLNTGFGMVRTTRTDWRTQPSDLAELARLSAAVMKERNFPNMRARMNWLVAEPERMTDEMVNIRLGLYNIPQVAASLKRVYGADDTAGPWRDEDSVKTYPVPALVFWTELNPDEGPDKGEYYADLLPNGMFYNMQDAAHWPQWEKPEEHDAVLIEWVNKLK